jgi:uncharacterized membrane protein YdjX (TVP38/TMEM64 family)
MKKFVEKRKKLIIDVLMVLGVLIVFSLVSLLVLHIFGVISFNGGIRFNEALFDSFKNSWYGFLIFILFQTVLTMFLCVVPGASMAFIILCTNIYEFSWQAFLISFISVLISSTVMYMIGKFGGYKLCVKILGKEDCDKSLSILRNKSTVYFPLMMMFPIFPDDALVMMAGTLKMKMKYFIPSIIIGRGIGIATIVFGFSIIPFESFNTLYDWLVFITVCGIWIYIIFKMAHKLNEKIEKSHHNSEEKH